MTQAAKETRHRDAGILRQLQTGFDELRRTIEAEATERRRLEGLLRRQVEVNKDHRRRIRKLERELRIWDEEASEVANLDPEGAW